MGIGGVDFWKGKCKFTFYSSLVDADRLHDAGFLWLKFAEFRQGFQFIMKGIFMSVTRIAESTRVSRKLFG